MENKVYKNKNMIRTKHHVQRFVYCNGPLEAERFMTLYGDKYDSVNIFKPSSSRDYYGVAGMIKKSEFDEIVKAIGLIKVKGTRYWKTETASV